MRRNLTGVLVGAGVICVAALAVPGTLSAQYYTYFSQNKVQYQAFDFKIIQTEHFEVYYYERERAAALDAARIAERSYARLSRVLHHQFHGRKPIILYASGSEFQETNAINEDLSEGIGGVTEFFKHRMVLPFTGSYSDLQEVIQHEMVHQFQYDIYSQGRIGGGVQTMIAVNPPGWFMEGMAAYLSRPAIDPETGMWLRDAALEGHLPTIEELTYDPSIFPYRYGQALWAYVGERWGDEAIGEILQASVTAGVPGAFRRVTGLSFDDLSNDWRDAVRATFLPQIGDHYSARRIAQPVLTEKRSNGTLHLAPALTPDGRQVAFFGEERSFFIDLYLADAETGRVLGRLAKSTVISSYESLRFINSAGTFSPDGKYFALAVKHKDRDDLVILDVKRRREVKRIIVPLNGVTTPAWSPDGKQLVFTGYDGGLSDLFIINTDGSRLRRLTNDKYADLQPTWSPDGKTIAFATDRGTTDLNRLKIGSMQLALYHLDSGVIELLGHMDRGKNINPEWAPDGSSIAFISDRNGISNVYLYDLHDGQVYQLTDVFTGVQGITQLSPVLSWARQADRLAFIYYEGQNFNVYTIDNPRSLRRQPYADNRPVPIVSLLTAPRRDTVHANGAAGASIALGASPAPAAKDSTAVSIYRGSAGGGFRPSASAPQHSDTGTAAADTSGPISLRALTDSVDLALPDTSEFTFRPYHVRYAPDYVARPTLGYERDNFGRGIYGGTAIQLSDMLGNHTLVFAASVNGRPSEAQAFAGYINQAHRLNWVAAASQDPFYFYAPSGYSLQPYDQAGDTAVVLTTRLQRFVVRQAEARGYYPFNRFDRLELGMQFVNIDQAILEENDFFLPGNGAYIGTTFDQVARPSVNFLQPQLALVHDNALNYYVGPISGSRWRFEIAPAIGDWRFVQGQADYRRYFFARPFTLAVRGKFWGRYGRDGDLFPVFLGNTELIRGYTAGSFRSGECVQAVSGNSQTGCAELDQLIGSRVAVANVELRFPLTRYLVLGFLPIGFPPIEGALFYDAGVAWNGSSVLKLSRSASDNVTLVRAPLRSYGTSIRVNMFGFLILRADYTKPLNRPQKHAYWTVSLGPTF